MAYIDKVCEYSDTDGSYEMGKHQHNHIQIKPEYRKIFKGKTATLIFFKSEPNPSFHHNDTWVSFSGVRYTGGTMSMSGEIGADYILHNGVWYEWRRDRCKKGRDIALPMKILTKSHYCLDVPELQGRVKGRYTNTTYEKMTVIRKLKRMVGSNLKIVKSDLTYGEYWESKNGITG